PGDPGAGQGAAVPLAARPADAAPGRDPDRPQRAAGHGRPGGGPDPRQRPHLVHARAGRHAQARRTLEDRFLDDRARGRRADPARVLPLSRAGDRAGAAVPHRRRHGGRPRRAARVVPAVAGQEPRYGVNRPRVVRIADGGAASRGTRRARPGNDRRDAMTTTRATRMLLALLWLLAALPAFAADPPARGAPLLVIHGGAGVEPGDVDAQE